MGARSILGLVALICLAGACVLLFFDVLAGAVPAFPLTLVYWLEVDTSKIANAPHPLTAWTLWNSCGVTDDDKTMECSPTMPAYPFDPPSNFGTTDGVPAEFASTNRYYYLTRVFFGIIICALFFSVCSLLLGLFALCSKIGSYLSSVFCAIALLLQCVAAALMTAAFVQARNAFMAEGTNATLGRYGFAFVWAPVALLFIATILFCAGGKASSDGGRGFGRSKKNRRSVLSGDASSFTRA